MAEWNETWGKLSIDYSLNKSQFSGGYYVWTSGVGAQLVTEPHKVEELLRGGGRVVSPNLAATYDPENPGTVDVELPDISDKTSASVVKTVDQYLDLHPEISGRDGARELVQVYIDEWTDSGSETLASDAMYASPLIGTVFPGIMDDQGVARYTITQYIAEDRNYNVALAEAGLNPFLPILQDQKASLFENQIDSAEFAGRLRTIKTQVIDSENKAQVLETYNRFFSDAGTPIEMTDESLFLLAISPEAGQAILQGQFAVTDIGVEAALAGFNISKGVALDLYDKQYGVGQAAELFGQANIALQNAAMAQARKELGSDVQPMVNIEDYLAAFVDFDADAISTFTRIGAMSTALSSAAVGAATTETGQVVGLIE